MPDPSNSDFSLHTVAELGALIRAVRVAADLSQADAAAFCGVSAPFLSALERGKPTARIGLVLKVFQGLGISMHLQAPLAELDVQKLPQRKARKRGPQ